MRYLTILLVGLSSWASLAFAGDLDRKCGGSILNGGDSTVDSSIAACTRIIESGKTSKSDLAVAYYNRGDLYENKYDPDRAIADFNEAIRLNPKYADAWNLRGGAYLQKSDYDRAIADLDEAFRLNPTSDRIYELRGQAYQARNVRDNLSKLDRVEAAAKPTTTPSSPLTQQSATEPAKPVVAVPVTAPAVASPTALPTDKRIALVIGNSEYRNVGRLDNPVNDAKLVADALKSLGFKLVGDGPQLDLDKAGFDSAVQSFGNQLQGADVGLFYYAGHGVQVRGTNYLVPVSANPTREADVDFQMVDAALVLRQMEAAGTKLNVVMLDACRNNPFGGRGLRSSTGGLAQMQAPEGTLISYATQPGNVAQDGADGDSPYTKALVEVIRKPGLDVLQTFNQVGVAVKRATGGSQQPWVSSSPIEGDFYFAGK